MRKALPNPVIPAWLNPRTVDVDDPLKLPLCWYGVTFLDNLVFDYTGRIGIAKYMRRDLVKLKKGDLDIFGTWANFVR